MQDNNYQPFISMEDLKKCRIDNFNWNDREVWISLHGFMATDNYTLSMVTEENGDIYSFSHGFIPEDKIEEVIVDIEKIHNVSIMGIGYDRYNNMAIAQRLEREGYVCVGIVQAPKILITPTEALSRYILDRKFFYIKNRLLEMSFQNTISKYDIDGNLSVGSKDKTGEINMVLNLINAIYLLLEGRKSNE